MSFIEIAALSQKSLLATGYMPDSALKQVIVRREKNSPMK